MVLGIVVVGVLLFNNVGSSLAQCGAGCGARAGTVLTTLAFLVLLYSLWQGWLIVRTGGPSPARPSIGAKRPG